MALALKERGQPVTVVDPAGMARSPNTLCAFADQLPAAFVGASFARTVVVTSAGELDLRRPYARLDSAALANAAAAVVDVVADRVEGLVVGGRGVVAGGVSVGGAVVVDASGHRPVLVEREAANAPMQSAFGLVVRGVDAALPPGTALFMDWRTSGVDDGGPPSFLYALSGDDGRILLEETTLASTTPVSSLVLKRRLLERLRRRGTRIDEVIDEEHVAFPMGAGLPRRHQHVAAFGAAAGLVQPISGYSIARAFAAAPVVADAIVAGVVGGADPVDIAADVDAVLWSAQARRVRALQRFGLSALCGFDAADSDAFFSAFFALPTTQWRGFLDGDADLAATRSTMWRLFRDVPGRVRRRLATGAGFSETVDALLSTSFSISTRQRQRDVGNEGDRP